MHANRRAALALVATFTGLAMVTGAPPRAAAESTATTATSTAQPTSRREFNIVPLLGGSSDVGVGVGQASDWARLGPQYQPYRWRVATEGFITFKLRTNENLVIPFQDYSVQVIVPELLPSKKLRLTVRAAYTDESTLKFYGLGNNSPEPPPDLAARDAEYGRVHPTLSVNARMALASSWFMQMGSVYTQNWLDVRPGTVLDRQRTTAAPDIQARIGNFDRHAVELIELGVLYDSRDNEVVTQRGMFHKVQARLSPSVPGWLPYAYQQINLSARFYVTPIPQRLTFSWRVVSDTLFGTPPFYELARFEETPALGGGNAVRGVPAQRYYGKVKLFQNLEARTRLWSFSIAKKAMVLGAAVFFDAGRTWTEVSRSHPELDGTGWGLKYGFGGGLRLQQGSTFVVRADIAWSPDARPVGGYFAAGEIF